MKILKLFLLTQLKGLFKSSGTPTVGVCVPFRCKQSTTGSRPDHNNPSSSNSSGNQPQEPTHLLLYLVSPAAYLSSSHSQSPAITLTQAGSDKATKQIRTLNTASLLLRSFQKPYLQPRTGTLLLNSRKHFPSLSFFSLLFSTTTLHVLNYHCN